MHSLGTFLLVALAVTLTPGPTTALVLRVAARDGRAAARSVVIGNSIGVLVWALLSAVGVSALVLASQVAYDVLRFGGAAVLVVLGVRSLLRRSPPETSVEAPPRREVSARGRRVGLIGSLANPKLAMFFVALFPQFLDPHAPVVPAAMLMAAVIVGCDLVWFTTLGWAVDRAGSLLRPKVRRVMEAVSGTALVGVGLAVAAESR